MLQLGLSRVVTWLGSRFKKQRIEAQILFVPTVATAKINRVATNISILKRKGMPANHKTKQRSHDQRKRVRESVTRGEGMSTPHAHRTRWYPRLCLNLWVCKQTTLIWTKMNAKCRERKDYARTGPTPLPTYLFCRIRATVARLTNFCLFCVF